MPELARITLLACVPEERCATARRICTKPRVRRGYAERVRIVLLVLGGLVLVGALAPFALSLYTTRKIERMHQVRGEAPGATFVTGRIEKKWTTHDPDHDAYWINGRYPPATGRTTQRDNVEEALGSSLVEGGPIRVALLPNDS